MIATRLLAAALALAMASPAISQDPRPVPEPIEEPFTVSVYKRYVFIALVLAGILAVISLSGDENPASP